MTMSPTSAMLGVLSKKKSVQFGGSVDWEEERLRSYRGMESRKRRKAGKVAHQKQHKQLQQAVLDILRDPQCEDRIVSICGSEEFGFATQCIILAIIENGIEDENIEESEHYMDSDQDGEMDEKQLRRLLVEFRVSNKALIKSLEETDLRCIDCLVVCPDFTNEFASILPTQIVSTSTSGDINDRKAKRQRQGEKQSIY